MFIKRTEMHYKYRYKLQGIIYNHIRFYIMVSKRNEDLTLL